MGQGLLSGTTDLLSGKVEGPVSHSGPSSLGGSYHSPALASGLARGGAPAYIPLLPFEKMVTLP